MCAERVYMDDQTTSSVLLFIRSVSRISSGECGVTLHIVYMLLLQVMLQEINKKLYKSFENQEGKSITELVKDLLRHFRLRRYTIRNLFWRKPVTSPK